MNEKQAKKWQENWKATHGSDSTNGSQSGGSAPTNTSTAPPKPNSGSTGKSMTPAEAKKWQQDWKTYNDWQKSQQQPKAEDFQNANPYLNQGDNYTKLKLQQEQIEASPDYKASDPRAMQAHDYYTKELEKLDSKADNQAKYDAMSKDLEAMRSSPEYRTNIALRREAQDLEKQMKVIEAMLPQEKTSTKVAQFGNIDIDPARRGRLDNGDGTYSTVDSFSRNDNGKEVLVPTVVEKDGKLVRMTEDEAWQHYLETGENLGKFDTPEAADAYANLLHKYHEDYWTEQDSQPKTIKTPGSGIRLAENTPADFMAQSVSDANAKGAVREQQELSELQAQRDQVEQQLSDLEMSLASATEPAQRVAIQAQMDKLLAQSDDLDEQIANKQQDVVTNKEARTASDVEKEATTATKTKRQNFWDMVGNANLASILGQAGQTDEALDAATKAQQSSADWREARQAEKVAEEELKDIRDDYRLTQNQRDQYKARIEELTPTLQNGVAASFSMTPEEFDAWKQSDEGKAWVANYEEYNRLSSALENDSLTGSETVNRVLPGVGNRLAQAGTWAAGFLGSAMARNQAMSNPLAYANNPELMQQNLDAIEAGKQSLYDTSFDFGQRAQEIYEEATKNKTSGEKLTYAALQNVTEVATDALVNTLTGGGGLAFMGFRVFGSEASNAMSQGASEAEAALYGLAKAGVEVLTEKMFDGLYGVYGEGVADDLTKDLIFKMTENPTVAKLLTVAFAGAGESVEELASGLADPLVNAILTKEVGSPDFAEIGDSMLIASIIGALGGSVQVVGNQVQTANGTAVEIGSPEWRDAIMAQNFKNRIEEAGFDVEEVYDYLANAQEAELNTQNFAKEMLDRSAGTTSTDVKAETTTPDVKTDTASLSQTLVDTIRNNRNTESGRVSNKVAEAILSNPSLKAEFEKAANIPQIEGTKSEQRQAVKDNADKVVEVLSTLSETNPTELTETAPEVNTSETATTENAPEVTKALTDILENSRDKVTGNITPEGISAILADQKLVDLFNSKSDVKITAEDNFNNRNAISDNADLVIDALSNTEQKLDVMNEFEDTDVDQDIPPEEITSEDVNNPAAEPGSPEEITSPTVKNENLAQPKTTTISPESTSLAVNNQGTDIETTSPDVNNENPELPPAMKRSQTESNTMQSVSGALGGEQEELYYIPKSEKQTLAEAAARVRQDIAGEMERLMNLNMWEASDVDSAMMIYSILQVDGVRNHDFSAAQAWGRVIQPRGTSTGQALQAFSKWAKTGAGVVSDAIADMEDNNLPEARKDEIIADLYKFAERYDSIIADVITDEGTGETVVDVKDLRKLILDMNAYRKTGTFDPKNFGKMLNKVTDAQWLAEYALRQLMAIPNDYQKPSLAKQLKTWQVNSQLTRLGTFERNLGGNFMFGIQDTLAQDGLGWAIDWLVSKGTGVREVGFDKGWANSAARKAAMDALRKSILEVAGDIDMTGEAEKYGNSTNRTNKMVGNQFARFMSRWEQLMGYSLTSSDRFFRGQIEQSITDSIMQANKNNPEMTLDRAREIAKQMADYRLFQNNGTAAKVSRGLHDLGNYIGVKGPNGERFGVGDLINPYPGVPANLAVKSLEYSPANIVKGGIELVKLLSDHHNGVKVDPGKQQQAVMDISRGISGTPIIALFTLAFKHGIAKNLDDEKDKDAKAQKKAEGQSGVQLNLSAFNRLLHGEKTDWRDDDDVMSISWLEPTNAFLAIASMVADEAEDDTYWSMAKAYPNAYLNGSLQSVLDMPVMSNIKNMFDTINNSQAEELGERLGEGGLNLAGNAISGMIPAPFGQLAKSLDDTQRNTKGDTPLETVLNGIVSNIPWARETLTPKLDAFGNEIKYSGSDTQRWLNNFALPGAVGKVQKTELQQLTDDLYESTGNENAIPDRQAPKSLKFGNENVSLTTEQQDAYQQKRGQTIEDLVNRTIHTSAWNSLTDEEKVEALDDIYGYAGYLAKKDFATENGYKVGDSDYSKYEKLDDPAEGIIWDNKVAATRESGEYVDYNGLDEIVSKMGNMSEDVREMIENKDYMNKLEEASKLGIKSKSFFTNHDFLKTLSDADSTLKETGEDTRDYAAIDKGIATYGRLVGDSEEAQDVFSSYYSRADELYEAQQNGMDSKTWYQYYDKYKAISDMDVDENGEKISAYDKHDMFSREVAKGDLTDEQKQMLNDQLKFFTGYNVENTTYDKMLAGGADPDNAYRWIQEQGALQPLPDHKTVTSDQKAFVVLNDKSISPADRMDVLLKTEGSTMKPNMGNFARWLSANFSYAEANWYYNQMKKKYGWKTGYGKALKK